LIDSSASLENKDGDGLDYEELISSETIARLKREERSAELIIKKGVLSKKLSKQLFGSKRNFVLTSQPRFYNTTLEGNQYKGEFMLSSDL
jgi:hypothetical protein